ncbi:hypothetical protein SteCoe_11536 [Stentor coeruleus]|uniref:Uncharacterized protein n=1 Tax=Stentor coeruleus TaxID=5963 RepID=A0A1R2CCW2_9CILI|nr:hypothetical protein SteCoe_11536 [Stentor coeruleus]
MWLLFVIKALVLACDDKCLWSCQIMNAQESCYKTCGCDENIRQVLMPKMLMEEGVDNLKSVAIKISCDYAGFQNCGELECPYKYTQCIKEAKCEDFIDFKFLVENIPSYLWMTVQPKILDNIMDDGKGKDLAKDFNMCVEYCYDESLSVFKVDDEGFYRAFRGCSKLFCGEGLDDEREKCDRKCEDECVGNEDKNCKDLCLEKQCLVYTASKVEDAACDNECYNGCYLNDEECWSCYLQCLYYECSDTVIYAEIKPFKGACEDECYSDCYQNGVEDEDCYNDCIDISCEVQIIEKKPFKGACENECYIDCYINGVEDEDCYNECINISCGVQILEKPFKGACEDECYSYCYMNGEEDENCYNNCIAEKCGVQILEKPFKGPCENECVNQCYFNGEVDEDCYNECIAISCGVEIIEKKPFKGACEDNCYNLCHINGEEDEDCYNECIAINCDAVSYNKDDIIEKLMMLGGVNNCGQICFQQCFVNYQIISSCYNSCMNTCTSVANSGFLFYGLNDSPQECAQRCTTMKGLFDKECYDECLNSNEHDDVECEWKCYCESLESEIFNEEKYQSCIESKCKAN